MNESQTTWKGFGLGVETETTDVPTRAHVDYGQVTIQLGRPKDGALTAIIIKVNGPQKHAKISNMRGECRGQQKLVCAIPPPFARGCTQIALARI